MIFRADEIKAITVTSTTSTLFVKRGSNWYTTPHVLIKRVPTVSKEALDNLYKDLKGEN